MIDWSDVVTLALEQSSVPFASDGHTVVAEERRELLALRDYVNCLLATGKW
jgi:hypothetical protein